MSEQLVIQTVEGMEIATNETTYVNVVELVTSPTSRFEDIRPYEEPAEDTVFPVEYAFHLLDGVHGRTVVDLGCGAGLNTVILARLGARVISIDNSGSNLEMTEHRANAHGVGDRVRLIRSGGYRIPAEDASADRVLCSGINQYSDPLVIARQIRRILKPGGRAVFHHVTRPLLRKQAMTKAYADALSRAVGVPGRFREFWLTTALLCRVGVAPSSSIARVLQRLDDAVIRRFPFTRLLASSFVWAARKES